VSNEYTELITNSEFNQNQMEEVTMLSSLDLMTVSAHMLDHFQLLDLGNQNQRHDYAVDFEAAEAETLKEVYNFALKHVKMGMAIDKTELPASAAITIVEQGEPSTVQSIAARGPMNQVLVKARLSDAHLTTVHKALVHFVSNHSRTVDNDSQRRLEATAQFLEDNYPFLVSDWGKIRRKI